MPATVGAPARPNTREMIVIHNVFRRIFGDLPGLVRAVTPGDAVRAGVLADLYAEIATALHHHHATEDELLWPTLLDRVEVERGFVLCAEEQHERVHELLEHGTAQAGAFRVGPTTKLRDEFAATIEELFAALSEHLADEERHILPLVEQHLTVAEWDELGERGRASIPKDRLLIQLGWILDCIPALDRREFLRSMPLPARILWPLIGRRSFAAEKRKVYGG
jgi:iron-sulfur cluster repair protein YtfE (RIC family)